MDAMQTESHEPTAVGRSVLHPIDSLLKCDQATAGRPGHDWLICDQFRFPTLDCTSERNPGPDFMSA